MNTSRGEAAIVREYARADQFITHNFDFEWRGYSYGVQPAVDHKTAARCLMVAGCDIYHPTQDKLTGKEIAVCGALCRSLKNDNYLVLESQAQGHVNWTPYEGQMRLHAFSHVASGANSVMYWHWHSIHNSFETYWKGLLSHDLQPNAPLPRSVHDRCRFQASQREAREPQEEKPRRNVCQQRGAHIAQSVPLPDGKTFYNDVVRWLFDALYEMNVECDMLFPRGREFRGL